MFEEALIQAIRARSDQHCWTNPASIEEMRQTLFQASSSRQSKAAIVSVQPMKWVQASSGKMPAAPRALHLHSRFLVLIQLMRTIHRRQFVALGQCGVVEHVADQVAHGAVEVHHQLPDVHQFAGLLADDVYPQ